MSCLCQCQTSDWVIGVQGYAAPELNLGDSSHSSRAANATPKKINDSNGLLLLRVASSPRPMCCSLRQQHLPMLVFLKSANWKQTGSRVAEMRLLQICRWDGWIKGRTRRVHAHIQMLKNLIIWLLKLGFCIKEIFTLQRGGRTYEHPHTHTHTHTNTHTYKVLVKFSVLVKPSSGM